MSTTTPEPLDPSFQISLPSFEGPLDLLLHLIRKHELDILDLPIAFVTERYLAYVTMMEQLDLDIASEYLVMAATLAHIKSKMLLPQEPEDQAEEESAEEEIDPRAELIRRLLEYQKYKDVAEQLGTRGIAGRDVFLRGSDAPEASGPTPLAPTSLFRLLDAFQGVLKRAQADVAFEITTEGLSIQDRMRELTDLLRERREVTFEMLFEDQVKIYDLVITFMALLEMAKRRLVRIYQADPHSPIHLRSTVLSEEEQIELPIDTPDHEPNPPEDGVQEPAPEPERAAAPAPATVEAEDAFEPEPDPAAVEAEAVDSAPALVEAQDHVVGAEQDPTAVRAEVQPADVLEPEPDPAAGEVEDHVFEAEPDSAAAAAEDVSQSEPDPAAAEAVCVPQPGPVEVEHVDSAPALVEAEDHVIEAEPDSAAAAAEATFEPEPDPAVAEAEDAFEAVAEQAPFAPIGGAAPIPEEPLIDDAAAPEPLEAAEHRIADDASPFIDPVTASEPLMAEVEQASAEPEPNPPIAEFEPPAAGPGSNPPVAVEEPTPAEPRVAADASPCIDPVAASELPIAPGPNSPLAEGDSTPAEPDIAGEASPSIDPATASEPEIAEVEPASVVPGSNPPLAEGDSTPLMAEVEPGRNPRMAEEPTPAEPSIAGDASPHIDPVAASEPPSAEVGPAPAVRVVGEASPLDTMTTPDPVEAPASGEPAGGLLDVVADARAVADAEAPAAGRVSEGSAELEGMETGTRTDPSGAPDREGLDPDAGSGKEPDLAGSDEDEDAPT